MAQTKGIHIAVRHIHKIHTYVDTAHYINIHCLKKYLKTLGSIYIIIYKWNFCRILISSCLTAKYFYRWTLTLPNSQLIFYYEQVDFAHLYYAGQRVRGFIPNCLMFAVMSSAKSPLVASPQQIIFVP